MSSSHPSSSSSLPPRPARTLRCFAPLSPNHRSNTHTDNAPALQGIVFDVDGTLCLPQNYMFKGMREALGIPKSIDILDHIASLSDVPDDHEKVERKGVSTILDESDSITYRTAAGGGVKGNDQTIGVARNAEVDTTSGNSTQVQESMSSSPRSRAIAAIQAIERQAMTRQQPQPGLQELMTYLSTRGIRKALCTRNFPLPVFHLLDNFLPDEVEHPGTGGTRDAVGTGGSAEKTSARVQGRKGFYPIITRDTPNIKPKPSPEGILFIAREWDVQAIGESRDDDGPAGSDTLRSQSEVKKRLLLPLIMVGDSIDDLTSGRSAGAATVLLVSQENQYLLEHEKHAPDVVVKDLRELIHILEEGFGSRVRL